MIEIWVDIPEYLGFSRYQVTREGKLRKKESGNQIHGTSFSNSKYLCVNLYNDFVQKKIGTRIHILICETFHGKKPSKNHTVDHIDKDRSNNHYLNLRWADKKEQIQNRTVSERKAGKPVYQLNLEGDIIARFETAMLAQISTGICRQSISIACRGLQDTAGNCKWRFCEDIDIDPDEIWRRVPARNLFYDIYASNKGRVRGPLGIYAGTINDSGYRTVGMTLIDGKHKNILVHRIICLTFNGKPPVGKELVNHKNGNRIDNSPENLEWVSHQENTRHAFDTDLVKRVKPIIQYDLNWNELARFKSIKEATQITGCAKHTIRYYLNGTVQNPQKYRWKYVNQ